MAIAKKEKEKKKKLLRIKIIKNIDRVEINIKASKEIENFFSRDGVNEERSSKWKDAKTKEGVRFYKPFDFNLSIDNYYFYSDFGSSVLYNSSSREVNIAPLRITGISCKGGKRIVLENVIISYSELEEYIQILCRVVEYIYKMYLIKVKIENVVNVIIK